MNMKRLLTFLGIAAVSASLLASCELLNCGNQGLQDLVIPDKAKPSEEMTYGSIAAESHAAHAVRYTIKGQESPYESVELFGDGTYLIAKTGATSRPQLMHAVVRKAGNGLNVSIPKSSSAKTKAGDEYFIVGGYEMKEEGNYSLEDFGSLKIDENDGNINLTFENTLGNRICTVFASESPAVNDDASASLCRTWNVESLEQWAYLGILKILELKYVGGNNPHYEGTGVNEMDKGELQEIIDEQCSTVTFSPYGTYCCTYNNGNVLYSTWMWANEKQGTLFYDWQEGENEEGYVTARFKDNKCLLYEDYTIDISSIINGEEFEDEDDELESDEFFDITQILGSDDTELRYLILNTLVAAK